LSAADCPRSAAYGWYALGVLFTAYVLAFVDRQVLNLLAEPIKRDLGLSDVQLGLLQGLSFALVLSIGAFPVGRLIDRGRRTGLLAASVGLWSLATAACGFARGYLPLLGCRVGVGLGEAAVTPCAYSLIGDYIAPRRLGLAIGVFSMGSYLGSGLALIFGGALAADARAGEIVLPVVGALRAWQAVFILIGAPGLLVAAWVATLAEPARRGAAEEGLPALARVFSYFRANGRAIGFTNAAVAFGAMAVYALSAWVPSLLSRHFGLSAGAIGLPLGLEVLAAGAGGTFAAGWLGDLRRRAGHGAGRLEVMLAAGLCALPFGLATALASSPALLFAAFAPLFFALALLLGSGPATLQEITPNRLRGVQHALAVFASNLIGLGLGPLVVAGVTQYGLHDERRLDLSLAICLPVMLLASAACAALARAPYRLSLLRQGDPLEPASAA
jgi:MFS family permease